MIREEVKPVLKDCRAKLRELGFQHVSTYSPKREGVPTITTYEKHQTVGRQSGIIVVVLSGDGECRAYNRLLADANNTVRSEFSTAMGMLRCIEHERKLLSADRDTRREYDIRSPRPMVFYGDTVRAKPRRAECTLHAERFFCDRKATILLGKYEDSDQAAAAFAQMESDWQTKHGNGRDGEMPMYLDGWDIVCYKGDGTRMTLEAGAWLIDHEHERQMALDRGVD